MKRTPIIVPGQVYLHTELNEYAVVTRSVRQQIQYRGIKAGQVFSGMNEAEVFLERFGPVDPEDLTSEEAEGLTRLLPASTSLSVGWVVEEDDDEDEDLE